MSIIPFYGAENREMFAIERAAMDRPGKVISHLNESLPVGLVLDVGAGDGFTADALASPERRIVGVEPAPGMVNPDRDLGYVRAGAESLPFADGSFEGAYATWAYFFPGYHDVSRGLSEIQRVVRRGGNTIIVDNFGDDAFSSILHLEDGVDADFWAGQGFSVEEIETVFEFSTGEEADLLMSFYAGQTLVDVPRVIEYRVAVMTKSKPD